MKTYIADLFFDHVPDPLALIRATANAFGMPNSNVAEGWFIDDATRAAYADSSIRIVWLRNHDQTGQFPYMYGLAIENADPGGSMAYTPQLAAITHALGIAAVMPTMYGKMHVFGPDGSDRLVERDEDADGDDILHLSRQDRASLERSYRTSQAVAS